MNKMIRKRAICCPKAWAVAALAALLSSPVAAFEISGRFSTDVIGYGERISSLNNDNASFKLYATITPSRAIDASLVINAEKRAYFNRTGLQNYRYRALYLRYRTGRFELDLGRQYITEATGTSIDGIKIRIKTRPRISGGLFAGLKANPYERGIKEDCAIFGLFSAVNRKIFDATASYTAEFYRGKLNRGYMTFQSSIRYKTLLRIYENLTVDTDEEFKPWYLTYLHIGAYVTPHRRGNFSVSYSRHQAYQEHAFPDLNYLVSFFPTHRYTFRGRLKLTRHFSMDVSRGVSIKTITDSRNHSYSIALNSRGLGVPGLSGYLRRFRSWGDLYFNVTSSAGASYALAGKHVLSASISEQWNQTRFAGVQSSGYIVTAAIRSNFLKRVSASLSYTYNNSAGPAQNGLFTHVGYRF